MTFTLQGRELGAPQLGLISQLMAHHPDWSRRRLSRALCEQWNWRNGVGQLKDMASRTLLLKLEQRGLIQLPPRRQRPSRRMSQPHLRVLEWDRSVIDAPLKALGALLVSEVSRLPGPRRELAQALAQFHYLGFCGAVGQNLQYTVRDPQGRLLACLVFGSAAWSCKDRDRVIGWTQEQRRRNLPLVTNNCRFLIMPWVRVPLLASWTLGAILRRLSQDWQIKYGHPIHLVETFVQAQRFRGTAYQAANWIKVGQTTGRTRQDRFTRMQMPRKDIYLYALDRRFAERLSQ